jgi:electron transfer flavoprotein alpha subunit
MILVVAEQRDGKLNRASWEAVAAAQKLAAMTGGQPIAVAVAGGSVGRAAADISSAAVARVLTVEDPALEPYTADGFVRAMAQLVAGQAPTYVLVPHTYLARDFVPKLASTLDAPLIADVVGIVDAGGTPGFTRLIFQGKLAADVVPEGDAPYLVTLQAGAFSADSAVRGSSPAPMSAFAVAIDAASIRQKPEAPFREAKQAIDLSQAARIVAVGRGIRAQDKLPLAEELARALDAELAASRPICDAGWLPLERQVGSSGQTVAPKLYLALGISGAIQHAVGMKAAKTIVAINKDAEAPIFELADYGIVGDLFEIVPALVKELQR